MQTSNTDNKKIVKKICICTYSEEKGRPFPIFFVSRFLCSRFLSLKGTVTPKTHPFLGILPFTLQ